MKSLLTSRLAVWLATLATVGTGAYVGQIGLGGNITLGGFTYPVELVVRLGKPTPKPDDDGTKPDKPDDDKRPDTKPDDKTPGPLPSPPSPQPPVPGPVPPVPAPTPGPVDGRFHVARAVWDVAKAVASPDRVSEAKQIALNFRTVAADVRGGKLNGSLLKPQWMAISGALGTVNKPIVDKQPAWKAAADQLADKIAELYGDDRLKSNADWADLFEEIATGLEAVK